MNTKKIKIAIADDHNLFRQSVAMALKMDPVFELVGQAENGKDLLDILGKNPVDVVLLDLEMPVMNGWKTQEHIKADYPHCKVVIVSMYFEELMIKELINNGARGFIPKDSDFETLISAIHEVNNSGYFFHKKISKSVVNELVESNNIQPVYNEVNLSDKEVEVLLEICKDKLNKEISETLFLSERTIERIKTNLFTKTDTQTNAGLVLFAIKNKFFKV